VLRVVLLVLALGGAGAYWYYEIRVPTFAVPALVDTNVDTLDTTIGGNGWDVQRTDTYQDLTVAGPYVATLQPGVRGVTTGAVGRATSAPVTLADVDAADPEVLEVLPADPATMDLAEATAIVGGGAGVGSRTAMDTLARVATTIGCSVGATRVVTDWGWVPFERQIGTTGVTVHPQLYLAFGVSGAVQHVTGLGDPEHVIAVNTDASCPMMALADLALVTDAPALVDELARRLGVDPA
jgi:electron transfer flavoprotein alpha subunit